MVHTTESTSTTPPAPRPPRVLRPLFSQFGRPRGWLGRVAGWVMARNTYDDRWVVDLLDVQPTDRVLDVGFGPGVTIELLAERATRGLVAGVDPSSVMLHQALRRNARFNNLDLRLGTVEALPFDDGSFDKACALHSAYFWASFERGAVELHRVLVPKGRVVVAVRMRLMRGGLFNPSRFGFSAEQLDELCRALAAAGFTDVRVEKRDFPRDLVAAVFATRD